MPSATTTLDLIGGTVIDTGVSLAQTVFTTYWPYFLVGGVIVGLVYFVKRLIGAGRR